MELLQEEDEQEEWKEAVKQAKIRGVRHRFQVQMERNVRKEDYVFRNAPKSRPQSAAAIRTGAKFGKDVGGRSRPTSAMPLSSSAISSSSAQEKEEKVRYRHLTPELPYVSNAVAVAEGTQGRVRLRR